MNDGGAGLTSIIIPTYNGLALLQKCVAAIRRHTDPVATPYELIVVDDGSQDGTAQWCAEERISFIRLPDNAGFPRACNQGMRLAAGEQLLLLNNDVMACDSWLSNMLRALHSSGEIGLVGPVTNYASGSQRVDVAFSDVDEFQLLAAAANRSDPGKWEPTERIVGFCLLMKREVYKRVGGMDERFGPGHYEDDDYCLRARSLGYGIRICRDTLVYHAGSASFKQDGQEALDRLVKRNRRLFVEKWNFDPAYGA